MRFDLDLLDVLGVLSLFFWESVFEDGLWGLGVPLPVEKKQCVFDPLSLIIGVMKTALLEDVAPQEP